MDAFVLVRGCLCDPRHIELNDPAPIPEREVEVWLRTFPNPASFWKERTIEELAAEQGVAGPQSLDELMGQGSVLWGSEREFDEFVDAIQARRRIAPPGSARE